MHIHNDDKNIFIKYLRKYKGKQKINFDKTYIYSKKTREKIKKLVIIQISPYNIFPRLLLGIYISIFLRVSHYERRKQREERNT